MSSQHLKNFLPMPDWGRWWPVSVRTLGSWSTPCVLSCVQWLHERGYVTLVLQGPAGVVVMKHLVVQYQLLIYIGTTLESHRFTHSTTRSVRILSSDLLFFQPGGYFAANEVAHEWDTETRVYWGGGGLDVPREWPLLRKFLELLIESRGFGSTGWIDMTSPHFVSSTTK